MGQFFSSLIGFVIAGFLVVGLWYVMIQGIIKVFMGY